MYSSILILPFISSIITGVFGNKIGGSGAKFIAISISLITWILALFIFYEIVYCQGLITIQFYEWILIDIYSIRFGLLIDALTSAMILIICTISGLVHLYSTNYMDHDPYISRFLSFLSLFTFFMLILISSDNFIQLFIGWEGVGLCSYLLINFWFTRVNANKAALKAMFFINLQIVFL